MLKRPTTYDSKVFLEFSRLDEENAPSVVHFFEQHQEEVLTMNFEERFIMLLTYANALYDVNSFEKHIIVADDIIELSIVHNIQFFNGEDIFLKTLFKKAKSYFQLHHYKKAEHVCRELVKLIPNHQPYSQLLRKSMIRQRPVLVKKMLATGVFLYLLSVVLIVINLLLVKPFSGPVLGMMVGFHKVVFMLGIGCLLSGVAIHHIGVYNHIRKFKRNALQKRAEKR